jgi:hypothetical protein
MAGSGKKTMGHGLLTNALSGKITATVTFRREDLARRKQAADRFSNVLANMRFLIPERPVL